jgi:two-component system, OmpR family, sensor kinase
VSRLPIRVRLTLVFAVVMTVVLAALGAFLYLRLGSTLDERVNERLQARSNALASAAAGGATRVEDLRFVGDEDGLAQVIDADGSITAAFGYPARSQLLTGDELGRARGARIVIERIVEGGDGDLAPARLVAEPVAGDSGRVVLVGESLEDRDDALDALRTQLLIALPLALLVSSAIGYLVAAAALRPMEAMRRRAGEISSSTSSRRLPLPAAHDEVHRLGETLNEMLERLDAGLERERRFAADASHELRTPLALLKAELELALRQPRSAGELEEALRSASVETDRLVQLAEDLLLVSRADQGRLPIRCEELDVDELLSSAAGRFQHRAADEGRPIQAQTADGLVLPGDSARLGQALANLVDNALRYGAGTVELAARDRDGTVELHVTDEGAGFDAEFLSHAFERFSRHDEARGRGGTGLGLAIVDAIARGHGGSAHAANRGGGGADVWLSLPKRLNDGDAALGDRARID